MSQEPTKQDILEAINTFSTNMEEKMSGIEGKISGIEKEISGIKEDVSGIKEEVSDIRGVINTQMVTKDYLDDKMADLRGDLVVLTRKEDMKVKKLVDILKKRKLISEKEVNEILSMEPFPQLNL